MSLLGEKSSVWTEAAESCAPEDIVDIADQLSLLQDRDPAEASEIRVSVGSVVVARLHEGTIHPELADTFFQQSSGYQVNR